MTYLKVPQKTLFDKKAWVHPKYLRAAVLQGRDLLLEHDGKYMLIKLKDINKNNFKKGDREFQDKFNGEPYYLYSIHFVENYKLKK